MPFAAVNVTGYVPLVPASGVPANTPLGASNATPDGNPPTSDNVGAGTPLAVTVNVPADPTVNAVDDALVIVGASLTVRVKPCDASAPTPLAAENVIA